MTESGGGANRSQRGVSQAGETDSETTMILNQSKRKKDEEQILGGQTVMRSLLGGSRGRCWPEEVQHPAGDRQVR